MYKSRLDPANPNSVLISNIHTLYVECLRQWKAFVFHRSGIYSAFYHKIHELFNTVCYTDVRAGGTLHPDFDRTKTDPVKIKRLIAEAHAEWLKLSQANRSKYPDIEQLVDALYLVPDYNPSIPQPPADGDNPVARHHPYHFGPDRNPDEQHTQLRTMLMRLKLSML